MAKLTKHDLVPVDPVAGWQAELRQAAFNSVNAGDVAEIVKAIVAKAKHGDPQSCKMVFEYLLGGKGGAATPAIAVNNVQMNYGGPAAGDIAALPIRQAKLDRLRDRASNGEALFHDGGEQ